VLTVALLGGGMYAYTQYGKGVEFFPMVEPDYGLLYVHARGNLSLAEMDRWRPARPSAASSAGRASSRSTPASARRAAAQDIPEDVVGVINYEFIDWRERKSAHTFSTICGSPWPAFRASMSRCVCRMPVRRPASRSRSSSPPSIRPA
jgi:multidrug efflux pump